MRYVVNHASGEVVMARCLQCRMVLRGDEAFCDVRCQKAWLEPVRRTTLFISLQEVMG